MGPLGPFLRDPRPTAASAAGALRLLFALMFGAQTLTAVTVALILAWLGPDPGGGSPGLSLAMVAFSLLELPVALLLIRAAVAAARAPDRKRDPKGAAIAATLLAGVLLSTPAWFAAFTLLVGRPDGYALALLGLLVGYYGLGFALTGSFARLAASAAEPPPTPS